MRVVTIVRPLRGARLERALHGFADVLHCASRAECERAVMALRPDALVVDPELLRDSDLNGFVRAMRAAGLPVVFYFPLQPDLVELVLPLIEERESEVLLADVDDSVRHLREVFAQLPDLSLQAGLLAAEAPMLRRLPSRVRAALASLVLDPDWSSAKELPDRAGISRRTIDRALREAGYAPLHKWCSVSQLGRAFALLQDPSVSATRAARAAGYGTLRSLHRAVNALLDREQIDEVRVMPREQFLHDIAAALVQTSSSQPSSGMMK